MANLDDEKTIQEELSLPILLGDRVIKAAQEAESLKPDCAELAKQVERLSAMLRSIVRLASTTPSLYERPIRRIVADISKNLERALTLVRKCKKHSGVLRQVFSMTTTADFRKVSTLLESSIGDVKWLLSIFDSDGGTNLTLPQSLATIRFSLGSGPTQPQFRWVCSRTELRPPTNSLQLLKTMTATRLLSWKKVGFRRC